MRKPAVVFTFLLAASAGIAAEDWRIVAADQATKSAVMFSGEPGAAAEFLWRWDPEKDPNLKPGDAAAFAAIDEVKPRDNGREILVNASCGGIASIDVASKKVNWYSRVKHHRAGPHSLEVLPDNRVAVADSTGGDALLLIDVSVAPLDPGKQKLVRAFDVPGAHGVVFDRGRHRLYVLGYTNLFELAYSPKEMSVKLLRKWDYSEKAGDAYGHDLLPDGRRGYYFTNHTGVWHFDPDTEKIEPALAKMNVKSYSRDRVKGELLSIPREAWWTDRLIVRQPDGTERVIGPFDGSKFYKARWMTENVADAVSAAVSVDGKLPAGNVIVEKVDGDVVKLRQDMRDSNNWFYWAFRVTGAEGRTVRFDFTDPYAGGPVSCRGPAVTKDGGKTWAYAAESTSTPSNFVYTFAKDEKETWFYQTFQYYPRQWDEFLARHAADRGKAFETGVLCKSRKGRDVPKARFGRLDGQAKYRVWLSSRTHCGEAPATYVIEGWLERVLGGDALGAWLRENVEFLVVPFVDYDGVVDGDQGKGRKPHDHNRDYVAFLYPESKAIADWLTGHAKGKIDVAFDCHSPWVRSVHNEKVYQTYHSDEWNNAAKVKWGHLLEKHGGGGMNYSASDDFPWKFGWNGPKNTASKPGQAPLMGLGGWIGKNCPDLLINSTYEIPFANAKGVTVTPATCRAFGSASAETLKDFLEEMKPTVREGVVYREDFDRFGNHTDCFNDGASVVEVRNGVLALSFTPKDASDFRRGFFPIAVPPRAADWKFSFDFAFPTDATRAFALKLFFGDRDNPDVRTLHVDERGSRFGYAPVVAPADGAQGFLPSGREWNKGAIVVSGNRAAFWTYRSGRLVKECEGEIPALPLVGWNFGLADRKGGSVRLDRVIVTDACSRPFDRGDPTEWLTETPPATRFQWDEYWGRPVTAKNPLAVDFTRASCELHVRFPEKADRFSLDFLSATGRVARVSFGPSADTVNLRVREAGGGVFTNAVRMISLKNEFFAVSGSGVLPRTCVRARPALGDRRRYRQREINEIGLSYDKLRTLKDLVYAFEVKRVGPDLYRVILNDNVLAEFASESPITGVFVAGRNLEAHGWTPESATAGTDAQTYALPLPPGGFALERVRENQGTYALECNAYLSRDAFDAMPSSCLFNVPKRQWVRAKAVCRVEPGAPTNAVPVITARLTQFFANGGRTMAMCEKTVDLRDANAPVVKKGEDYEVTFDLDVGALQDLVFMEDGMARRPLVYLHFEFTGPVWEKARYYMDPGRVPAEAEVSSLRVLSGSLEASPADFSAVANRPFSLYYPDEKPGATVTVVPRVAGSYTVEAVVRDEDGHVVETKSLEVSASQPFNFSTSAFGWYEVDYTLKDAAGKPLVTHSASFARIRPDTRKEGTDSPYYSWNFRGAHGTPYRFEDWAAVYRRLGIHRTTLLGAFTGGNNTDRRKQPISEKSPECVEWNMTHVQFPYVRGGFADEKGKSNYVAKIRAMHDQFPHVRTALVFHESGNGPFPKEVYGGVTEIDDATRAADAKKVEAARQCAEAWRAVDPTVKLIHGNSSSTIGLVARLMRGGYPKELMDAMGEESVGMSEPPEMSTAFLPWAMKKLARHYGYPEAMDCPREWKSRYYPWRYEKDKTPAGGLLIRDALIAHALGYTVIPVGASTETGNSYADSIWCSGTFARWPLAYPRKAAAAIAYLTQVLDGAKFVRQVPTGSLTVYALEFTSASGYVYALWDARGETTVAGRPGEVVAFTGRVLAPRADGRIAVGEEPVYLLTGTKVDAFAADSGRSFPRERFAGMAKARTAQKVASTDEVELVLAADPRVEVPFPANPRRVGAFALSSVQDEEKGACVELKHLSKAACPEMVTEYATLRFREPKPVDGVATNLGVWVKGNSNWGECFLEFTDAEGEKWFSAGCGGVGCNSYDWPKRMTPNYDGWNFLQLPLLHGSPVRNPSPGDDEWQWTRDGEGNGRIDFPITVTAVVIGQTGRTLDLLEMKSGPDVVRVGPVEVW